MELLWSYSYGSWKDSNTWLLHSLWWFRGWSYIKSRRYKDDFAVWILCHPSPTLFVIIIAQSYSMFYASSKIHQALFQATMLILFKSHSSMNILKRVLNSFNVKIKSGDSLFQVFKDYCSGSHRYLVINLHPSLDTAQVYSNILYNCKESFIMFTWLQMALCTDINSRQLKKSYKSRILFKSEFPTTSFLLICEILNNLKKKKENQKMLQ